MLSHLKTYWLKSVLILAPKLTNPPARAAGWLRGCGPRSNKHCGAEQQKVSVHTFTHSHFAHRLSEINTCKGKDHKNWKQLLSLWANETCVPFFFFYFHEPFSKVTNAMCLPLHPQVFKCLSTHKTYFKMFVWICRRAWTFTHPPLERIMLSTYSLPNCWR